MRTSQLPAAVRGARGQRQSRECRCDALRARSGVLGRRACWLRAGLDARRGRPRPSRAAARAAAAQRGASTCRAAPPMTQHARFGTCSRSSTASPTTSPAPRCAPSLRRNRASIPEGARRSSSTATRSASSGSSRSRRLAAFEIRGRVAVGELRIDAIAPSPPRPLRYVPPPRFPAIVQDLAVTVAADRRAGDAMDAIREAHEPLLEHAELYDEYRGGSLAAGRKGWTFRLTFRARPTARSPVTRRSERRTPIAAALARAVRRGDSPVAEPAREWFARPTMQVARDLIGCSAHR